MTLLDNLATVIQALTVGKRTTTEKRAIIPVCEGRPGSWKMVLPEGNAAINARTGQITTWINDLVIDVMVVDPTDQELVSFAVLTSSGFEEYTVDVHNLQPYFQV